MAKVAKKVELVTAKKVINSNISIPVSKNLADKISELLKNIDTCIELNFDNLAHELIALLTVIQSANPKTQKSKQEKQTQEDDNYYRDNERNR